MAHIDRTHLHRPARRFSIFAMLRQMHSLARQRQALASLEPHRLKDIGISAYDAQKEANRPVWDAPDHWR